MRLSAVGAAECLLFVVVSSGDRHVDDMSVGGDAGAGDGAPAPAAATAGVNGTDAGKNITNTKKVHKRRAHRNCSYPLLLLPGAAAATKEARV